MLFLLIVIVLVIVYNCKNNEYKKSEYYQQSNTPMLSTITDKGKYGEYLTYRNLMGIEGHKKFLFNCYIPKENDETTEIDVIMIHETGIYVFESKNYSGWIFGTETNKQWTQTLPAGKGRSHKSHFLNPIMQNKLHIKWLRSYLSTELPIFSFIVFSERCTLKDIKLTSSTHYVIQRNYILEAVRNVITANSCVLSAADIDSLYDRLYALTQVSDAVRTEHVRQINEKIQAEQDRKSGNITPEQPDNTAQNAPERICPRCGAKLVLRTARKGENSGNQFWGCSAFPKCRFTENIDK
ncbi:MAG: NERD domain-containing protein [Huintestinicola sp.]